MEKDDRKLDKEQIEQMENEAVIKYEKNSKPYRQKFKSVGVQIKCQQCGSSFNLMKHVDTKTGKEFWFCKTCVMERARQITKEREGK